ncbi:MAG: hypothetical protein AAFO82_22640 [Bacteroidota bacterium]
MEYIKIKWEHSYECEPTLIYSELDSDRYEIRKIEIYPNGDIGYASEYINTKETSLGEEPFPEVDIYNKLNKEVDDEWDEFLEAEVIEKSQFEDIWVKKVKGKKLLEDE